MDTARTSRVWGVVLGALLTALATSCNGTEAAPPSAPSSSASVPTAPTTSDPPEVSIDEPTLPKEAGQPGKVGVRAQVDFLVENLNYAMLTGETAGLRELAKNCSGCRAYADLYDETYERGGAYVNATWAVTRQLLYKADGQYFAYAGIEVAPGKYRENTNSSWERIGDREYELRVVLDRRSDSWAITGLSDAS